MQTNPDPEVGEHPGVAAGADGRFHIDRLVPGQRYTARIFRQQRFMGTAFVKLVFKAGEVRDLGDIRVKSSADVASIFLIGRATSPFFGLASLRWHDLILKAARSE
ncbi:MAG TPA: hypothetical protein VFI31_13080 [Pirellulales bacterium]|nr:hypothetical protein [Pirellulales bacterium]